MYADNSFIDGIFSFILKFIVAIFDFIFSFFTMNKVVMFVIYFVLINVLAFILMKVDKKRAQMPDSNRIRERTLLTVALVGGSLRGIHCNV